MTRIGIAMGKLLAFLTHHGGNPIRNDHGTNWLIAGGQTFGNGHDVAIDVVGV